MLPAERRLHHVNVTLPAAESADSDCEAKRGQGATRHLTRLRARGAPGLRFAASPLRLVDAETFTMQKGTGVDCGRFCWSPQFRHGSGRAQSG